MLRTAVREKLLKLLIQRKLTLITLVKTGGKYLGLLDLIQSSNNNIPWFNIKLSKFSYLWIKEKEF